MDWDKLTAEQKAELVATKVNGWHAADCMWRDANGKPTGYFCGDFPGDTYYPTENIAQAWEVQERITALGLRLAWAARLSEIIGCVSGPLLTWWVVAWATPDQRCHAAVLAVEGASDAD